MIVKLITCFTVGLKYGLIRNYLIIAILKPN